jgi:RNA polymerase sigma-70 factor (ECF subfamily)
MTACKAGIERIVELFSLRMIAARRAVKEAIQNQRRMLLNDEFDRQLPSLLPRLWRFALRLTRQAADAEDLVQRSCLRALEKRHQWRPGTALLSWLFAIMHSIWLNELRSTQRRREAQVDWEDQIEEAPATGAGTDPEQALMYRQVISAVQTLPEAQRLVLLLVAAEGLSYREASEVLDIPLGTVMSRLSRARATVGRLFLTTTTGGLGSRGTEVMK